MKTINLLLPVFISAAGLCHPSAASCMSFDQDARQEPIIVEEKDLLVTIDPATCRWSARLKGTDVGLGNIHFIEGDNPSGWFVTAGVNHHEYEEIVRFHFGSDLFS